MWSNNYITINWDLFKAITYLLRVVSFVCLTLAPCVGTQRQDTWYSDTGVDLVKTIDKETPESCSWNQCKSALPKPKDKETCESCSSMHYCCKISILSSAQCHQCPPVLQSILLSSPLNPIWDWGILHWSLIRVQKVHAQDLRASRDF